jgi:AcrR family transcriptional regulator
VSTAAPQRKPRNAYHHGHLRQALVDQAVQTIRADGVEALTLRDVGVQLRVSRTALYRHFADKQALLAAVATEGFRAFRIALSTAWEGAGRGRAGFLAQGGTYIRFALDNPSHYRVMFGGYVSKDDGESEFAREGEAAFRVLVDALIELQQQGLVRPGDALQLALFVWASVHGTAMLAIGGQLRRRDVSLDELVAFAVERVWDGVAAYNETGLPRRQARPHARRAVPRARTR